ncbi:MAG: murein transglycosylase A [Propionivibrio sp.]|jgi:membrane-bound lytic murein transglycosylase A|nr:murein transglycosylase A [Propionivibrio sp.]MBP7525776.1 murein transglycosylase A [Propionivibrio sp.]
MPKSQTRKLSLTALSLVGALLGGCATIDETQPVACPSCPKCVPCSTTGVGASAQPPAKPMQLALWSDLPGWSEDDPVAAWPAFLQSCRGLVSKPQWALWRTACEEANGLPVNDSGVLRRFFESRFAPYLLTNPDGTTNGLVTGYYEPLLRGSRNRTETFAQPLLGVPPDLLTIDLADVLPDLKNMRLRGRLQGNKVVPYYSRADIIRREKGFAERVLFWVDDAIELFFLQVQGSGRIKLPDGKVVRVGYADQNGHPYQSIGRVLIERGDLKPEQASMQGIQAWARANPEKLDELLNANPSYVFFRELPNNGRVDAGPIGALGVPLTKERSIAVDPASVPLGAPVFLVTTRPNSPLPLRRLVLAQDTGGAIRGAVRADFFWGFGAEAGTQAGRMKQQGKMWVLLPPGVVSR